MPLYISLLALQKLTNDRGNAVHEVQLLKRGGKYRELEHTENHQMPLSYPPHAYFTFHRRFFFSRYMAPESILKGISRDYLKFETSS